MTFNKNESNLLYLKVSLIIHQTLLKKKNQQRLTNSKNHDHSQSYHMLLLSHVEKFGSLSLIKKIAKTNLLNLNEIISK